MAVINHAEIARQEAMKEAYDKFKESLTKDADTHAKNFHLLMVFNEMEQKIERQEVEIKRYKSFFLLLKSFLPESFLSNTLIG